MSYTSTIAGRGPAGAPPIDRLRRNSTLLTSVLACAWAALLFKIFVPEAAHGAEGHRSAPLAPGLAWIVQGAQGTVWSAEGNQESCELGYCVAGAGDVNGDGFPDVAIGAPLYDTNEGNAGRVFAYYGSAEGLQMTLSWSVAGDQNAAEFGVSVAGAGDVNGDGFDDVIVGASHYDGPDPDAGRVYLFLGGIQGLSVIPSWVMRGDIPKAHLGRCVAGAGDVNNDGYDDVIIGSFNYRNPEVKEGRAYLYLGGADGLSDTPAWTAEGDQSYAYFAMTVAGAGDVNNDGYDDVIVGATDYDVGSLPDAGRAYVFLGNSSGLSPDPAWIVDGDQQGAHLGRAVACAGDLDGDGYDDVIVGASEYDITGQDEGLVRVYRGTATGVSSDPMWVKAGGQAGARFGYSAAGVGDVDNDGHADVAVGAHAYDNGDTDEGKVFIYRSDGSELSAVHAWSSEGGGSHYKFGMSVAGAGDIDGDGYDDVIIGSPGYGDGQVAEGRAVAYFMAPDTTGPAVEVLVPDGGEVWYTENTYDIVWSAADASGVDSVGIYYSADGGDSFVEIASGEPNDEAYSWTVPPTPSDSALVKVIAYDPSSLSGRDTSDGLFSITPDTTGPTVAVTAPNGLETWYVGSDYEITWTAADENGVDSVSIYYSTDGGAQYSLIASGEPNDSSYAWTVPDTPSDSALVRVTAYDSRGNPGADESDMIFAITPDTVAPSVLVVSPNGGEAWAAGSTRGIEWIAFDDNGVDSVSIYYSTDGGAQYSLIASGEPNDSTYIWEVPFEPSDAALIDIVAYDRAGLAGQDTSAGIFSIVADSVGPAVSVVSPNGGETWGVGNTYPITWTATDPAGVDSVSIYYSTDAGAHYSLIASGEENDSLYLWDVPAAASDSALVKVVAYDRFANAGWDASDSLFVISTDVAGAAGRTPDFGDRVRFWGNSPNPFSGRTAIAFYLPKEQVVRVEVFDAAGRLVTRPVDGRKMRAGVHTVPWNGTAGDGGRLGSGVYFCMLTTEGFAQTRKMILAR